MKLHADNKNQELRSVIIHRSRSSSYLTFRSTAPFLALTFNDMHSYQIQFLRGSKYITSVELSVLQNQQLIQKQ